LISLAAGLGFITAESIQDYILNINWDWQIMLISSIVAILFLIVSVKLLFSGVRKPMPQSALLKNTELGKIRVSHATLDTLTQKAVRSFNEVKDVKSVIIPDMENIKIQIKLLVMPDVNLPELTISIQKKVKDYVETLSGIVVNEVQIYVDNLATVQKARVE